MKKIARRALRKLVSETRGAEIAEAAAVLPLMFLMLLGIFWFGQAFSIYGAITRAAQEGARAGAISPNCATCTPQVATQSIINAENAVQAALTASQLDYTKARTTVPQPNNLSCSNQTAVACQGSPNYCIQTPVLLNATGLPGAMPVCGISVSFQYPFQFWLPFTSLNKQVVLISATGRMHMETR